MPKPGFVSRTMYIVLNKLCILRNKSNANVTHLYCHTLHIRIRIFSDSDMKPMAMIMLHIIIVIRYSTILYVCVQLYEYVTHLLRIRTWNICTVTCHPTSPVSSFPTDCPKSVLGMQFFVVRLWFHMWPLFCLYLFLISPSFGRLGRAVLRDCDISGVYEVRSKHSRSDILRLNKLNWNPSQLIFFI